MNEDSKEQLNSLEPSATAPPSTSNLVQGAKRRKPQKTNKISQDQMEQQTTEEQIQPPQQQAASDLEDNDNMSEDMSINGETPIRSADAANPRVSSSPPINLADLPPIPRPIISSTTVVTSNTEKGSYKCPLCQEDLASQKDFTTHIRAHNEVKPYPDPNDPTGQAKVYYCCLCCKMLSSFSSLDRHMLVHSGERPFNCELCGQTFTTNGNMHRHKRTHSAKELEEFDRANAALGKPVSRRGGGRKRKAHPGATPTQTDKPPSADSIEESFPCPHCSETFFTEDALESHSAVTHEGREFACLDCGRSFPSYAILRAHKSAVHKSPATNPIVSPFTSSPSVLQQQNVLQSPPTVSVNPFSSPSLIPTSTIFSSQQNLIPAPPPLTAPILQTSASFSTQQYPVLAKAFMDALNQQQRRQQTNPSISNNLIQTSNLINSPSVAFPSLSSIPISSSAIPSSTVLTGVNIGGATAGLTTPGGLATNLLSGAATNGRPPLSALNNTQLTANGLGLHCNQNAVSLLAAAAAQAQQQQQQPQILRNSLLLRQDILAASANMNNNNVPPPPPSSGLLAPIASPPPLVIGPSTQPTIINQQPLASASPRSEVSENASSDISLLRVSADKTADSPKLVISTPQQQKNLLTEEKTPKKEKKARSENQSGQNGENNDKSDNEDEEENNPDEHDPHIRDMKLKGEFPCRLCPAIYPNLRALKGHNKEHMNRAPYECNVGPCPYSSNDKSALVRHMRIHTGEKPFECKLCNYGFTTKANCERHLKNKHGKTNREAIKECLIVHESDDPDAPSIHSAPTVSAIHKTLQDIAAQREAGNFRCKVCKHMFESAAKVMEHALKDHPAYANDVDHIFEELRTGAARQSLEVKNALGELNGCSMVPRSSNYASLSSLRPVLPSQSKSKKNQQSEESSEGKNGEDAPLDLSRPSGKPMIPGSPLKLTKDVPVGLITPQLQLQPSKLLAQQPQLRPPQLIQAQPQQLLLSNTQPLLNLANLATNEELLKNSMALFSQLAATMAAGKVGLDQQQQQQSQLLAAQQQQLTSPQQPILTPAAPNNLLPPQPTPNANNNQLNLLALTAAAGLNLEQLQSELLRQRLQQQQPQLDQSQLLTAAINNGQQSSLNPHQPGVDLSKLLVSQSGQLIRPPFQPTAVQLPGQQQLLSSPDAAATSMLLQQQKSIILPPPQAAGSSSSAPMSTASDDEAGSLDLEEDNADSSLNASNGILVKKNKQKRYRTERPYVCDFCSAGFTLRSNMERHMKAQHSDREAVKRKETEDIIDLGSGAEEDVDMETQSDDGDAIAAVVDEDDTEEENLVIDDEVPPPSKIKKTEEDEESGVDLASVSSLLNSANKKQPFIPNEIFDEDAKAEEDVKENANKAAADNKEKRRGRPKKETTASSNTTRGSLRLRNKMDCPRCEQKFVQVEALNAHLASHAEDKSSWKCSACPLMLLTNKGNFQKHIMAKHATSSKNNNNVVEDEVQTSSPSNSEVNQVKKKKPSLMDTIAKLSANSNNNGNAGEQPLKNDDNRIAVQSVQ